MPILGNISSIWMWAMIVQACKLRKDNKESIRKYTWRWCEAVVQVNPSLLDKKINLFVNTFKTSYFE